MLVLRIVALQADDFGAPRVLVQPRDRFVDRDAHQPRRELRVAAKVSHRPVRLQIGLLHCVLGLSLVLEDAACGAVEHLVMALHQDPECPVVFARDALRKLGVG
jgi:hypothetical protein